jgi:hypothetical protein
MTRTQTGQPLERVEAVASELRASLCTLLGLSVSGEGASAQAIRRRFGLNSVFCHRLASALKRPDPAGMVHQLPGPESLRKFIEVARSVDASERAVSAGLRAVESFESLIREVAGDRSGLDAILSDRLPGARARLESEAKQAVYRGMRQIKGIAADVVTCTAMLRPSEEDHDHLDLLLVRGYFGLRRVRPTGTFTLKIVNAATEPRAFARTLDGTPVRAEPRRALLEPFCSGGGESLRVVEVGDTVLYAVDWGSGIGLASAHDLVLAELRRTGPRRYRKPDDPRPRTGLSDAINVPSRRYVFDLLLHREAYPDWEPRVRVLETGEQGRAAANDPTRDLDLIDVEESITPLGTGLGRCGLDDVPRYGEMLEHVLGRAGWEPGELRAFRTDIEYPIFGSQVQHRFDLRLHPAEKRG